MKEQSTTQSQAQGSTPGPRNDPAIDPQGPAGQGQAHTPAPESADQSVDQKNQHTDNDNEFSPGFKPDPDRPKSGEEMDADIDTDGG